VAADEQGYHDLFEHLLLSDDNAPDLVHNFRLHFPEAANAAAQDFGF
jgi:hypothetical protein